MSTIAGRLVLLYVSDDGGTTYNAAGAKVLSHDIAVTEVDATDKLSNGLRELAEGAGMTTHDMTLSGPSKASTAEGLLEAAAASDGDNLTIKIEEGSGPTVVFEGECRVTKYGISTDAEGVKQYSVDIKSAGDVEYRGVARTVTAHT